MTQISSVKPYVKPTFFKCFAEGIKRDLKALVPVWGTCTKGDDFVKQNQINENVKDIKTYGHVSSKNCNEKASIGKRYMNGFASKVIVLPFIGTYALGKYKIQHEQLKSDVENLKFRNKTENNKKPGVFKTYFTGLLEKIKRSTPILAAYTHGKNIIELNNMQNDISKMSV